MYNSLHLHISLHTSWRFSSLSLFSSTKGSCFFDRNESRFIKRIVKEIADQLSNSKLSLDEIRDPLGVTATEVIPRPPPNIVLKETWSRPAEGYLKINYDGAYTVRKGGLGVVARDTKGRFVAAKCRLVNVESEDEVVAMAALEALCLAKELGWPRVCFEGDSVRVVNALQTSTASDDSDTSSFSSFSSSSYSSFGQIISEIQCMSRRFQQSTFSVIHQKANAIAENLATHGLSNPEDKHWLAKPPTFLEYSLRIEKSTSSYC